MTDERIETSPPDRVAFAAEGVITMTEGLLGRFEGTSLEPVRIDVSVGESRTVETDLTGDASLRLETVDVGVETPDVDDLSPGLDTVRSSSDDDSGSSAASTGALAFTVEGAIKSVPEETLELVAEGSPSLESITFAVDDPVRGDGGSGDDVVLELGLLGYSITVRRNGTIEVGTAGDATGVGLL